MALIHTLMRLKEDGVVTDFDMIGRQKAQASLINGKSIVVFMADDYIVGATAIKESVASMPRPDYIVYNNWNKIVDGADLEARKLKIPFVSYRRFRHILDELLKSV
ncbi:MAG TPA: hypothetical protein VK206_23215 [Anaerolineales bacterium]|nr:hypothetical protein [Anaerolineales bacterium]HLO29338.1 hypothetical protein [Anaerolineales bacterium]